MSQFLQLLAVFSLLVGSHAFMKSTSVVTSRTSLNMRSTNEVPIKSIESSKMYVKSLSAAATLFSVFSFSRGAKAGLFQSDEQDAIDQLSTYRRTVFDLLDQLRPSLVPNAVGVYAQTQILKGGKDDADVVLNYMETYIKPCQLKMSELAPKLKLANAEDQTRIELLPLLMKGHILELTQAISEMKSEPQAKEVQEVAETLNEYLKLASTKYKVSDFLPPRSLTEKEYLGPLGCEFWGKRRVEGSNACENIPEK